MLLSWHSDRYLRGVRVGNLEVHTAADGSHPPLPVMAFYRSRGTLSTPTVVQDGDQLGTIRWEAYGTANYLEVAFINVEVDGVADEQEVPAKMNVKVTSNGGAYADVATFRSNGDFEVGKFKATQEGVVHCEKLITNQPLDCPHTGFVLVASIAFLWLVYQVNRLDKVVRGELKP